MKYYIRKLAVGFLFGFGFFLAYAIVDRIRTKINESARHEMLQKEFAKSNAEREENRLDAKKVVVTKTRLVKLDRYIKVAVRVVNQMEHPFGSASVLISLFDEDGLFGECNGYLQNFTRGEVRERVIPCDRFKVESFPENVRLEAKITHVQKNGYNL